MLIALFPLLSFLFAAFLAAILGFATVMTFESANLRKAASMLQQEGFHWPLLRADGTFIEIAGTAPSADVQEAALRRLMDEFPATSIRDSMTSESSESIDSFIRFQKSGSSIVLFGSVMGKKTYQKVKEVAEKAFPGRLSTEMLQTLEGNSPDKLFDDVGFALSALALPEISLVTITADNITVNGVTISEDVKQSIKAQLDKIRPFGKTIDYQLTAPPPPLVQPFHFHLTLNSRTADINRCHVETSSDRERIMLAAANGDQREVRGHCTFARGTPNANWIRAVETIVTAVNISAHDVVIRGEDLTFTVMPIDKELRAASLDFSALPAGYSVALINTDLNPRDNFTFKIVKGANSDLEFSGIFANETNKKVALLASQAALNTSLIQDNTVIDPQASQPVTSDQIILASEALNFLYQGSAQLRDDQIVISGVSDRPDVEAKIDDLLSQRLASLDYSLNITLDENINKPPPPMDPSLCLQLLDETQRPQKITFEPSSVRIRSDALDIIDKMVEVLRNCQHVPLEIAGHTDSQGREEMN